jgi:hypothetical protein
MGFWGSLLDAIRAKIGGFRQPASLIAWQPNALAPVFYGYRDYEVEFPPVLTARFAPGAEGSLGLPTHRARVFYPSLEGSPEGAPILSDSGRFPLIVFAHGECQGDVDHYKKWFEIPALLARAGFVVVVPELSQSLPETSPGDIDIVGGMIGWIRTQWEFRATVLPSPATGIAGHSFGGGVAAEFVRSSAGTISAFASLSGQTGEGLRPIATAHIPKLFVFGSNLLMDAAFVDLNPLPSGSAWASLPPAKHVAILEDIGHFDYLRAGRVPCEGQRGDCAQTPGLAAELLLMFFGRYLHPEGAPDLRARIPASLVPPAFATLGLTTDQEFYAGAYLGAFESVEVAGHNGRCGVALTWDMGGGDVGTTNVP